MSTYQVKELGRRFYDAIGRGDYEALKEILGSDYINHNPMPGESPDRSAFIEMFHNLHKSFPDLHVTAENMISEGNQLAARVLLTGTQKGEFMGVSPTNKAVSFELFELLTIRNNKIVERWGIADAMGVMTQLGAVQPMRAVR